jgi:hypothetical protein
MRRFLVSFAALAMVVALPACDLSGDPVGLTGTWEGEVTVGSGASAPQYAVTLRLSDTGLAVSGTGSVGSATGTQTFSVSGGTFSGTAVTLPLFFPSDPIPGALTGTLTNQDPGRIEGRFSGPADLDGDVRIELVAR